jgi:hypothetical protein
MQGNTNFPVSLEINWACLIAQAKLFKAEEMALNRVQEKLIKKVEKFKQ